MRYNFVTIYDLRFRYESLRIPIRFIRPSLSVVFSSFVYIESRIWSDETDGNRNLGLLRFVMIPLRFSNFVTIRYDS